MSKSNLSLGTKAWAERINATWRSSIESILNVGKLLLEAKAALPAGDFKNMAANELAFHQTTASRLMLIAKDNRLYAHAHKLPPHWGTLYELTKLTNEEFDRALETGVIKPEMERADVPKEPRNLSARRPRAIESAATEIKPAELPVETEQPSDAPANFADAVATAFDPPRPSTTERQPETFAPPVEHGGGIVTSVYVGEANEPEPEVQPFGSGDTVTLSFLRNRPDVNFWQALMLMLGEWTKLGSLGGMTPSPDTERLLRGYDFPKFVMDLDELSDRLALARSFPGAHGNAA